LERHRAGTRGKAGGTAGIGRSGGVKGRETTRDRGLRFLEPKMLATCPPVPFAGSRSTIFPQPCAPAERRASPPILTVYSNAFAHPKALPRGKNSYISARGPSEWSNIK